MALRNTDISELALTLNGKKKRIQDEDFIAAFRTLGVPENVFARIKDKYIGLLPKFQAAIEQSFLSDRQKDAYVNLLERHTLAIPASGSAMSGRPR